MNHTSLICHPSPIKTTRALYCHPIKLHCSCKVRLVVQKKTSEETKYVEYKAPICFLALYRLLIKLHRDRKMRLVVQKNRYLRKRNMHRAPVSSLLCRSPSPCAASFAGGSKPSSLSLFYKSWHKSIWVLCPLLSCGCFAEADGSLLAELLPEPSSSLLRFRVAELFSVLGY